MHPTNRAGRLQDAAHYPVAGDLHEAPAAAWAGLTGSPPTAQKIARAWKKVCVGFSIPTPKIKNTPPPWASQLNEAAGRSLDLHSLGALLFYQATSTAAASIM